MISNGTDRTHKIMPYLLPIMVAYFATKVPAGLALYYIMYNVLGIVQQVFHIKKIKANKRKKGPRNKLASKT